MLMFIGIVSQALLYICFAILLGSLILSLVPSAHRPQIEVPIGVMMMAVGGIVMFSFIPVLQLIIFLYSKTGFSHIIQSVLFTFEVGKAWVFTYILSNVLFLFIVWFDYRSKPLYAYVGMILTFALILAIGWSSHASSYDQVKGFFNHTAHFTTVSVWIGVLLVVSWFSKKYTNWLNFLTWFTPVALVCLLGTVVTGLILMTFAMELKDYSNAWMLPYGQMLLVKHLLIVPLLVYAVINCWFMKKKVQAQPEWNPKPWVRGESIVVLLIFSMTAAMGQQSPPHETAVTNEVASKVFLAFYQGQFQPEMVVQLGVNSTSFALFLLTCLFIVLMLLSSWKKASSIGTFFMSMLVVLCAYLGLIWSIQ